uniref:Alcohol acetyltransferase n=1 Tax=Bionectria ochroleuca TaxID=29856 RepID=A0A8H7TWM0_BIOOC
MAEQKTSTFGICGRMFSIAHELGYYRSVAVTGIYSSILRKIDLEKKLDASVQAAIREHPALCYGLSNQTTDDGLTIFASFKEVHRDDLIEVITHSSESSSEDISESAADSVLRQRLEKAHTSFWPAGKPAWRMIVIYHPAEKLLLGEAAQSDLETLEERRFDIAFVFHHAIADGLSGLAFHNTIMKHFSLISDASSELKWPLVVDWEVPLPNLVEERIDLNNPQRPESEQPPIHGDQPTWPGDIISLPPGNGYRSRVHMAILPPETLGSSLKFCKSRGITLTGYLHGLICVFLSREIAEAPGFRLVTPYSLRQFTKISVQDIAFHAASMAMYLPESDLATIRKTQPQSSEEREHVVQIAKEFSASMAREVAAASYIDELREVPDAIEFRKSALGILGKRRTKSYEISNLGVGQNPTTGPDVKPMVLQRLMMTQSGSITGHAFSVNCASVRGGPLTLSITWSNGVVEDELIRSLSLHLERSMERLSTGE